MTKSTACDKLFDRLWMLVVGSGVTLGAGALHGREVHALLARTLTRSRSSLYPGTDFSILRHNCFPIGPLSRAAQSYITNTLRDFEKARVERIPGSHALDISE